MEAPLGWGKTTVVADWWRRIPRDGAVAGWLTLADPENDPALFWRYVVGALRFAGSPAGERAEVLIRAPGADLQLAVSSLINDLAARPVPTMLVLDDYHAIREPECHELLALFLDHAPAHVHVVIATRSDPPLPLGSIRAAGQLAELRERDLRLTAGEAAAFVRAGGDLELNDDELALLVRRTEGWAAALRLAIVWLRGESDRGEAIRNFAGDNRHLADYLTEHVLAGLDPPLERFLLRTSILVQMCAPLCEAVTAEPGAAELLARIERANLLLVPLDGRREWYRYHHLFADLLERSSPAASRSWSGPCIGARVPGTAVTAARGRRSTTPWGPPTMPSRRHPLVACWMRMVRSAVRRRCADGSSGSRHPSWRRRRSSVIWGVATGRAGATEPEVERWLRRADSAAPTVRAWSPAEPMTPGR